jgi:hypothetical protein
MGFFAFAWHLPDECLFVSFGIEVMQRIMRGHLSHGPVLAVV